MIVLFTDFGVTGPYVGQLKTVLARRAPGTPVVDLIHDAPMFAPRSAAYLLAALTAELARDCIVLGVVDPEVGDERRRPVVVQSDRRFFVGPDNGLFVPAARLGRAARWWEIAWRPDRLSATFHGRDLFAPVAAMLAQEQAPPGNPIAASGVVGADWPEDLAEIIYIDAYGNAMTGLRACTLPDDAVLRVADREVQRRTKFADVARGAPFWYQNSIGLAEIAVNQGHAGTTLALSIGDKVSAIGFA